MTTLINKYPPRLSNIELLRLLAMLGVLVVHADFGALGEPTRQEWLATPGYTAMRTLAEAFAIVAVNVFVLISGWFGIRFRWSALGKLLFQCAFFFFGIYFTLRACGVSQTPPLKGIYMCLMFSENAWFVKAYVGMFILAPVMNAFMENATRRQAATLLVVFFTFQSLYGWLSAGATYIEKGYSAFSFMGLYLLARYVRTYRPRWSQWSLRRDWAAYVLLSLLTAAGFLTFTIVGVYPLFAMFESYTSPLIIAAALFLLLAFSKMPFRSKAVNGVASSCFAVYLFHFIVFPTYMRPLIQELAATHNGMAFLGLLCALLLAFYAAAIALDKVRLGVWNTLLAPLFKRINNDCPF